MSAPFLSIVVPIHNESASIPELFAEFAQVLGDWGRPYEVLAIDDGSTDDSFGQLAAIQSRDARVRVVRFRRNFGQTAAFAAGFALARGAVVVTCDGDLQNDPRDIPALVAIVEQGADIACGWREDRKDRFLSRRVPSMLASWLISLATGVRLHDYGCSLKAFRSEVVKPLRLYGGMHRLLPAIASERGATIVERVVNHRARRFGRSKYGLGRIVPVVLDLLTVKFFLSHAGRPIRVFGALGVLCGGLGVATLGWLGWLAVAHGEAVGGHAAMSVGVVLVLAGVQFVTVGLLAEMQARTYYESQDKPTYVIRDIKEDLS
ncbi:MAG: glycosyltransferase family 2 protein [Acidobacteriota bacterium]